MAKTISFFYNLLKLLIKGLKTIKIQLFLIFVLLIASNPAFTQKVKWSSSVGSTYSFVTGADKTDGSKPIVGWMFNTSFENKVSKYTPWLRTKLEIGIEQRGYRLDELPYTNIESWYDIKRRINYFVIKPSACYYSETPFHYLIKVGPYYGYYLNLMEKYTKKGVASTPQGPDPWETEFNETYKSETIKPREWGAFVGFRAGKLFPKERLLFLSLDYIMAFTTFDNTCDGCKTIQRNNSVSISGGILMYIKK